MAKKKSQKALSKQRSTFVNEQEDLLKKRVSSLEGKLFDKIFEKYLLNLKTKDGKIVDDVSNRQMAIGLNKIYKLFQVVDNAPVIGDWLKDMNKITELNEKYFENISKEGVRANKDVIKEAVNKKLGLNSKGEVVKNGFTDKFLKDEHMLKQIKKVTTSAIVKKQGFEQLRERLKKTISGDPALKTSGGLHQYYRNYAYDTYQQIDRLAGQKFADAFGMTKFIYQGGLIATSRPFCEHYNGRVVDAEKFSKLKIEDLPENQRSGIPTEDWNPLLELGGFGCRHSKDWIQDSVAELVQKKFDARADKKQGKT